MVPSSGVHDPHRWSWWSDHWTFSAAAGRTHGRGGAPATPRRSGRVDAAAHALRELLGGLLRVGERHPAGERDAEHVADERGFDVLAPPGSADELDLHSNIYTVSARQLPHASARSLARCHVRGTRGLAKFFLAVWRKFLLTSTGAVVLSPLPVAAAPTPDLPPGGAGTAHERPDARGPSRLVCTSRRGEVGAREGYPQRAAAAEGRAPRRSELQARRLLGALLIFLRRLTRRSAYGGRGWFGSGPSPCDSTRLPSQVAGTVAA